MAKGIKGERIKAIKRDSEKSIIVYLNNGRKLKFTAKYDYYGVPRTCREDLSK